MNGLQHIARPAGRLNRLMKWPLLGALLGMVLSHTAYGTDSVYYNNQNISYYGAGSGANTVPFPPAIDATNFWNDVGGQFNIFSPSTYYETKHTLNYTNNGIMTGEGFVFDTWTGNVIPEQMAANFYNSGEIECLISNAVWATNIMSPGTVFAAENARMSFTGETVDLSRTTLSMEGVNDFGGQLYSLVGQIGVISNAWSPSVNFQAPNPSSPPFLIPPSQILSGFQLVNATVYANDTGAVASNREVQVVFIENQNPAVANNVYFDPSNGIRVEFSGAYVNPSTGQPATNYLDVSDNFGERTNFQLTPTPPVPGVPVNYTVSEPANPFSGTPSPAGLPSGIFGNGTIMTNNYSYYSFQEAATTASTNNIVNGALTNLPGRIEITASRDLNLALASISGPNYLTLTSTNNFEGSIGADIESPYSEINLGVTNGFMTITNLLVPLIPVWDGPCQLWSARWKIVDSSGTTNAFHVLLINSALAAVAAAQVQDLTLHGTNLVISDVLNVMRNVYIDAKSLTLTTNASGATSPDGELNLQSSAILWSNCIPNLRALTNNGAIRAQNLTIFGAAPPQDYTAFINNGLVSVGQGTVIWADDFENAGQFPCGAGSFILQSTNTVLTNGYVTAGGKFAITTGTMLASNVVVEAGGSIELTVTNLLDDGGVTNGNFWFAGGGSLIGLKLPIKPVGAAGKGDLRGTTIYCQAPGPNKNVVNTWAATNSGASVSGYTNNVAVGRLILDSLGASSVFTFNGIGVGTSNAMYVDYLEFDDWATNNTSYNMAALSINTNMTVYFAQAIEITNPATGAGTSIAEKIDNASRFFGKNNGRLLWIPTYAGHFSSTNIVYPDGSTNTFNAALAQSTDIDSDNDGTPNAGDPTPFSVLSQPVSGQLKFTETLTNVPPRSIRLSWKTITNNVPTIDSVYFATNLISPSWVLLFQTNVPPSSSASNISILDPLNLAQPRYYQIAVQPWLTYYGY